MLSEAKVTEIYDMAADFCKKNDIKLTLFAILAYTAESLQGALRSGDTLPSNLPQTAKHSAKQSKCGFIAP